jgi:hypothetical protein
VPGSSHTTFERGQSYVLTPVNLPEEPETFERPDFTGEFVELTETRWFSWFSTAGPEPGGSVWEEKDPKGLDESVTHADVGSVIFATGTPNDTELLADDEGSPYLPIWVVMRDGRGGVSWCRQDVPYVDVPSDE